MKKLIPLILVIFVVYLGVKLISPWYSQSSLESSIEKILNEYDGRSVLDMDESDLQARIDKFLSFESLPVNEENINLTWERDGDELLIGVDISYPLARSLFGFDWESSINVYKERLITVDVDEEQRMLAERESEELRKDEENKRYHRDMVEKCAKMGGEWNGRRCVITIIEVY